MIQTAFRFCDPASPARFCLLSDPASAVSCVHELAIWPSAKSCSATQGSACLSSDPASPARFCLLSDPASAVSCVHELAIWRTPNLVLPRSEALARLATRHPPCRAFTNRQFGLTPNLALPRSEALAVLRPGIAGQSVHELAIWRTPNLALPRREAVGIETWKTHSPLESLPWNRCKYLICILYYGRH